MTRECHAILTGHRAVVQGFGVGRLAREDQLALTAWPAAEGPPHWDCERLSARARALVERMQRKDLAHHGRFGGHGRPALRPAAVAVAVAVAEALVRHVTPAYVGLFARRPCSVTTLESLIFGDKSAKQQFLVSF